MNLCSELARIRCSNRCRSIRFWYQGFSQPCFFCSVILRNRNTILKFKMTLFSFFDNLFFSGIGNVVHITPVLFALHWLPIRQRIQFKLLLLVYRCTHQLAPDYLTDLVVPYVPARSLRSADQNLLPVKRYNLERYGRRSFSVAGPSLWNDIRNSVSIPAFRSSLKTHLFREAFVTLM